MEQAIHTKEYLENENINISILITTKGIVIKSSLLIPRVFIHILMVMGGIIGAVSVPEVSIFLPLLIFGIIFYVIWRDFESINNVAINVAEKKLAINRKNVVKGLFFETT